ETPPARFGPLIQRTAQQRVIDRAVELTHATSPAAVAEITDAVLHQAWRNLPPSEDWPALYHDMIDDVANAWQDLPPSGPHPVFVHSVNPAHIWTLGATNIAEVPTLVSQIKERALDATPGIKSLHVAVSHQGLELLSRRASEEV